MRIHCKRDKYRYIRLPARFINENLGIDSNTNFCVDTGAPQSQISYEQAVEWRLNFSKLELAFRNLRVGGSRGKAYWLKDSKILFRDFKGKLKALEIPRITVLGPDFREERIPPLLGDDILRNFTLIVYSDRLGGDIILTDEDIDVRFPR